VLRLRPDGKTTEKVEVQIGAPQGDWIHITRGLVRGDQVVIAGASSITPGATIQPVAYPGGQP
jgi:multidrug efflux system membrane fusion protein